MSATTIEITDPVSGSRAPAPGALGLVQAFINTSDWESGEDELLDPASLGAWLTAHGLAGGGLVTAADLERALAVREGLRALALANNGEPLDPAPLERLNAIAGDARLRLAFRPDGGSWLEPAVGGVDAAIGRLLAIVFGAMTDGTWARFKACREDACRWAFYDHSKNRSGAWCSMAVCGNRTKTRAYRQRRRGDPGARGA